MFGLLALIGFLFFGMMLVGLVGGILKLAVSLLVLPFKLLGKLIALPFMAIGLFFKLLFGVMFLPVLVVGGVIAFVFVAISAIIGLLVPLMPLLIAGVVVWGAVKIFSRPAAVVPPRA